MADDTQTPETANSAAAGLGEKELDAVLKAAAQAKSQTEAALAATSAGESRPEQGDIEFLLNQAEQALRSIDEPNADHSGDVRPFQFRDLSGAPATTDAASIELVRNVQLDLKIELGRTHMYLEDVLKLRKGAVVPLDKLAGDPVDVFVNGRLIARGEVLVLNDNFCVRVAELIVGDGPSEDA